MPVESKQLESGIGLVTISGRLALGAETARLEAAVETLIGRHVKRLVLDIGGLDYVDSAGVGMLVACLTTAKKAGGELKLVGANARIRRILSMTGVDSILSLHETLADATS